MELFHFRETRDLNTSNFNEFHTSDNYCPFHNFNQHYCPLYYFISSILFMNMALSQKGGKTPIQPSWIAMGHMGMGGLSVDFSGIFHEINFHICIPFLLGHPRNLDLMDPRWVDFSGIRGDAVSGEAPTLAVHGSLLEGLRRLRASKSNHDCATVPKKNGP